MDFNRFAPGQDHLGLKKITVNNMVQDDSGLHEYLGYYLFRAGDVPASRSGYATLSFNGKVKGLYALIETQDNNTMLEGWFGHDDGNVYEGQYGTDLVPGRWEEFDQDNGSDTSKKDLKDLSDALAAIEGEANILPALKNYFDLDAYLAFAVTEIYLGHWDGYARSANNFAIHHDLTSGKWTFMPWGIDQVFEDGMGPYAGVIGGLGPTWGEQGGIVHRLCIQSQDCRVLLHQAFVDLFARVDTLDYAALAKKGRSLIEDELYAESNAHGDPNLTASSLDTIDTHMTTRRSAIKPWLPCLTGGVVDQDGDQANDCRTDCEPWNPEVHPGATEVCNFVDDDCNGVVDDPPECPKCKPFDGPGGDSYLLCFEALGWAAARDDCVAQGGDLASIHDLETAEALGFAVPDHLGVESAWIGLTDQAQEGAFKWSDGSPLDILRWGEGAPDEGPEAESRDCVRSQPWGWRDSTCDDPRAYVCQI